MHRTCMWIVDYFRNQVEIINTHVLIFVSFSLFVIRYSYQYSLECAECGGVTKGIAASTYTSSQHTYSV